MTLWILRKGDKLFNAGSKETGYPNRKETNKAISLSDTTLKKMYQMI